MAKALAYVSGVALAPGVSRNNRLYTREAIGNAVRRAQKRIADGKRPIGMYSHHETTNTRELVGAVTKIWQEEDGSARYTAAIGASQTGRDIASLVDPEGDEPAFLQGVSIRGNWVGSPRRERNRDGSGFLETASDLEIGRLDYTSDPGVTGAGVDSFRYADDAGGGESGDRWTISESAPEALVETAITEETMPALPVTEDAPPVPEGVREALRALFGDGIGEAATPAVSKRGAGLSDDGGRSFADPGYQADKKQRYDLSTRQKAKSAWSFISQSANAKLYTPAQLKRIKGRIKAALGKFGVTVAAEGWTVDPAFLLTEALAEYYGADPECAGSYSLSATNGPTTVTVCSYGLDPADLQQILAQACAGAGMALKALDPDMDADVDVTGPGESAPGGEDGADAMASRIAAAIRGESAETLDDLLAEMRQGEAVAETAPEEDPAPEPAAAHPEGTEVPAVSETTTTEAVASAPAAVSASPSIPQDIMDEALRKAAKKAAKRALAGAAPAESAPAAPAAVAESEDDRINRIVSERLAAERAASAVTETEDERVNRIVEERLVAERQALTAAGNGPGRKGLVTEHAGSAGASGDGMGDLPFRNGQIIPTEEWTDDQRRAVGGQLEAYVLAPRMNR